MSKITISLVGLIIALCAIVYFLLALNKSRGEKIDILELNTNVLTGDIIEYQNKNKELVSLVNGFSVDMSTFKHLNDSLYDQVSDLKLKLKRVSSVIEVREVVRYKNNDTIYIRTLSDSVKNFYLDDAYIKAELTILNDSLVLPNKLSIQIPNEYTIVLEDARYKGFLWWRRIVGAKMHIKNSNPYYEISEAKYFDFTKLKK